MKVGAARWMGRFKNVTRGHAPAGAEPDGNGAKQAFRSPGQQAFPARSRAGRLVRCEVRYIAASGLSDVAFPLTPTLQLLWGFCGCFRRWRFTASASSTTTITPASPKHSPILPT